MSVIADLGFTGIDIGVFADDTHTKLSSVVHGPTTAAERLRALVAQAGLEVADVFLIPARTVEGLAPNHPDEAVRDESRALYCKTLEFARALGAPGVTVLPGARFDGDTVAGAIERAAEELSRRVELADSAGLRLSVEGHSGSCADRPEYFEDLLRRTPGLQATLDPSHYAYAGFSAPDLSPLIQRTGHVQIRPCAAGMMQGRLVDNTFDLAYLIHALKAAAYNGWVATEFVWMEKWSCDRVDNTSETARLKQHLIEIDEHLIELDNS
jgi:sugar phosphate isomerase/epimerase